MTSDSDIALFASYLGQTPRAYGAAGWSVAGIFADLRRRGHESDASLAHALAGVLELEGLPMTSASADESIAWQDFDVLGGRLARNAAGQFEGLLELAGGLALAFVFDRAGASWGWQPQDPGFVADRTEEA